jgi:hypothetical protein
LHLLFREEPIHHELQQTIEPLVMPQSPSATASLQQEQHVQFQLGKQLRKGLTTIKALVSQKDQQEQVDSKY